MGRPLRRERCDHEGPVPEQGDGTFEDIAKLAWVADIRGSMGLAAILRHRLQPSRHWLGIRLQGSRSSRDAIGARVSLTTGSTTLVQSRVSGDSYLSCHWPILHFGLDRSTEVASLEVDWPTGVTETFAVGGVDRVLTLVEGQGRESGP